MTCSKCGWRSVLALGIGALCTPGALAQVVQNAPERRPPVDLPTAKQLDPSPPFDNLFRDLSVTTGANPKVGPGLAVLAGPSLSGPSLSLPIKRGFRPEDADIKLGRLYVDFGSVTAGALYSDNVDQSDVNRKSGIIMIVRADASLLFQISEGIQFSVHGAATWLPLQNKAGISGFGADNIFFTFGAQPLVRAQLTYDFSLAGWETVMYDEFSASHNNFGNTRAFDTFYRGEQFTTGDTAGRYSFVEGSARTTSAESPGFGRLSEKLIVFQNSIGVLTQKDTPWVTRTEMGLKHSDFWYSSKDSGLPSSGESFDATIYSIRDNLRFKPYLAYNATHQNTTRGIDQQIRAGIAGPITEQIDFLGDAGYYLPADGVGHLIWTISAKHSISPVMYQELSFRRTATYPERDVGTIARYGVRRVFGPYLTGDAFVEYSTFEDINRNGTGSTEYRLGLLFVSPIGPRTDLRFGAYYSTIQYDTSTIGTEHFYTARVDLTYHYSDTVEAGMGYQYEQRSTTGGGRNYYENVISLSLTKRF